MTVNSATALGAKHFALLSGGRGHAHLDSSQHPCSQLKQKREEAERKAREVAETARLAELERLAKENAIKLVEDEEKVDFKDNAIGV